MIGLNECFQSSWESRGAHFNFVSWDILAKIIVFLAKLHHEIQSISILQIVAKQRIRSLFQSELKI